MSVLLDVFVENLLPVFLAAGAGYLLASLTPIQAKPISKIAFYIFSPCLVFTLLTENHLDGAAILQMAGYSILLLLLLGLLAWFAARLAGLSKTMSVAVVLGAMLPNAGNYGLSVNLFAFGEPALAQASLFFVSSAVLSFTVGVYIASLGRTDYKRAVLGLLKIPTIYAVILALIFQQLDWQLPLAVSRTTGLLSEAAIPALLVLLGILLKRVQWTGTIKPLLLSGGMRLAASPILAISLAPLFGLNGPARQAGILEAAMPTAVMATVLATEFEVEPEFLTAVVFLTTLASPLTLTPLLVFLG